MLRGSRGLNGVSPVRHGKAPRHGEDPRLWPAVLGIVSVLLVLAAFIALFVINPGRPGP
jgi:hypothetical protein